MKNYDKTQIKAIFDENLNTLSVSEELKKRTLNKIQLTKSPSFFWLSNCAAIFIVSLICVSIYTHRTTQNDYIEPTKAIQESVLPQNTTGTTLSEPLLKKARSQNVETTLDETTTFTPTKQTHKDSSYLSNTESIKQFDMNNTINFEFSEQSAEINNSPMIFSTSNFGSILEITENLEEKSLTQN